MTEKDNMQSAEFRQSCTGIDIRVILTIHSGFTLTKGSKCRSSNLLRWLIYFIDLVVDNLLLPTSPSTLCLFETYLIVLSISHCIIKPTLMNDNEDVELCSGKSNEPGNRDGIVTSASFHSPHGIASIGSIFIVGLFQT